MRMEVLQTCSVSAHMRMEAIDELFVIRDPGPSSGVAIRLQSAATSVRARCSGTSAVAKQWSSRSSDHDRSGGATRQRSSSLVRSSGRCQIGGTTGYWTGVIEL